MPKLKRTGTLEFWAFKQIYTNQKFAKNMEFFLVFAVARIILTLNETSEFSISGTN